MSQDPFSVTVIQRPAVRIAGLKVRTNILRAKDDCPRLWHDEFGPRMAELASGPSESYGVSWMVDGTAGIFDYGAAMPLTEGAAIPRGMLAAELPEGLYAQCEVPSLAELAAAYQFIYMRWLPGRKEYAPAYDKPAYELYPADYMQHGRFFLCAPVLAR